MNYEDNNHSKVLLKGLDELRNSKQYCDVILKVDDVAVFAHKNILSAGCPYFGAMFNGSFPESKQAEIVLKDIDGYCLRTVIDYIYTGKLRVAQSNVQNLLSTASFLQMSWVQERCCLYLENALDASNCLGIKDFSEKQSCFTLCQIARLFTIKHFNDVMKCDEFLTIGFSELQDILSEDEVFAHSEDSIFCGILRWVNHFPDDRSVYLPQLLNYIHPALVSKDLVRTSEILSKDTECAPWVTSSLENVYGNQWNIFVLDKIGRQSDLWRYGLLSEEFIPLSALPTKAFAVSLSGTKNFLYVQGGCIGSTSHDKCYYYNIYRNRWHPMTPLRETRSHHRSCILDNYLYAIGGSGVDGSLSSAECVDLGTGHAMSIEDLLEERSSLGAVVHDRCIYIMGGESDTKSLFSAERYDPRMGTWMDLSSMNVVNSYCSSAVVDNYIYCCEGLSNSMERYDFRADCWEVIPFAEDSIFDYREFYELFTIDRELYSICGAEIAKYSSESNEWRNVFEFPNARDWDTVCPLKMQIL